MLQFFFRVFLILLFFCFKVLSVAGTHNHVPDTVFDPLLGVQ